MKSGSSGRRESEGSQVKNDPFVATVPGASMSPVVIASLLKSPKINVYVYMFIGSFIVFIYQYTHKYIHIFIYTYNYSFVCSSICLFVFKRLTVNIPNRGYVTIWYPAPCPKCTHRSQTLPKARLRPGEGAQAVIRLMTEILHHPQYTCTCMYIYICMYNISINVYICVRIPEFLYFRYMRSIITQYILQYQNS